jgi:hypothetical protein
MHINFALLQNPPFSQIFIMSSPTKTSGRARKAAVPFEGAEIPRILRNMTRASDSRKSKVDMATDIIGTSSRRQKKTARATSDVGKPSMSGPDASTAKVGAPRKRATAGRARFVSPPGLNGSSLIDNINTYSPTRQISRWELD